MPASREAASGGPLDGIRVLDLSSVVMGPLATQILGDLGADVITVETRDGDIRLRYPDVAAVRPDVIYCQAHGFPSDGPQADAPAFDDIIQAACGVPDVLRRANGRPDLMPTLLADKVSGLVLAYSIMAALFHRARTGEGQRVEVPMADAMLAFLLVEHGSGAISRPPLGPAGYQRILTPLRGALRTADGWIAVQPHRAAHWAALLRAAGHDELVGDPRLSSRALWREPGFGYATLSRVLATKTTVQWLAFCADAGIPAAAAAGLDELIEGLPDDEHPDAGWYKVIPPPTRFSATPAAVRRPAPLAGQHTREVLAEAGLTEQEITRLARAGLLTPDRAGPGSRAPAD